MSAGTPAPPGGIVVVDKPEGWTSHDVVARMRRLAGTRRVGHAGTLDPMATGVLVLGVDRATKLLTFLVGCDKDYSATVRLGQSTVTDDAEGETSSLAGVGDSSSVRDRLPGAVAALSGAIEQVPSSVSAIKVGGVRSYAAVRRGEDVTLAARPVTVSRFEVTAVRDALTGEVPVLDVDIEVTVSSGTYVRALARDLGQSLGVGGHLTKLRRTRVGAFTLDAAHTLDDIDSAVQVAGSAGVPLVPLSQAGPAALPVRRLSEGEAARLRTGARLAVGPGEHGAEAVAALAPDGSLVAVLDQTGSTTRIKVMFAAQ